MLYTNLNHIENAEEYVISLNDEIESYISVKQKTIAPDKFKRFGKNLYYISIRKNKQTTWYVFFTIHGKNKDTYAVRYITNNHVSAQHIRGLR